MIPALVETLLETGDELRPDSAALARFQRDLQVPRIPLDDPVHQIDLLEHGRDRGRPGEPVRHEHRPELRTDVSGPQPRQVGVQLGYADGEVDLIEVAVNMLAQRPRQVVVPVEHGRQGWLAHRFRLVTGPPPDRCELPARSTVRSLAALPDRGTLTPGTEPRDQRLLESASRRPVG